MSSVRTSIHIDAPPQEVWELVMNPDRSGEWVTIHRGNGDHDDGPLRPGYQMSQRLCLRGISFDVHWELVEVDAPWYALWEGRGPARSTARIVDRLSEQDGGTCFDYENEFKAPLGPLGAAASRALVGGLPQREADASLHKLKALIERGQPTPQNR